MAIDLKKKGMLVGNVSFEPQKERPPGKWFVYILGSLPRKDRDL